MNTTRTHTQRLFALVRALLLLYVGVVAQVASSVVSADGSSEVVVDAGRKSP